MRSSRLLEHIQKIFSILKEYYLFIPLVVYGFGFLFVQGMFSPMFGISSTFGNVHLIVPVSHELYLINGLFCTMVLTIGVLFAYIFYVLFIGEESKTKKTRHKKSFIKKFKDKRTLSNNTYLVCVVLLVVIIITPMMLFLPYKAMNIYLLNIEFGAYFVIYFGAFFWYYNTIRIIPSNMDTTIYLSEYSSGKININEEEIDALQAKEYVTGSTKLRKNWHNINASIMMLKVTVAISLGFTIYVYGFVSQAVTVNMYEKGQGHYEMANVYLDKEQRMRTYLYMDLNKDYFIGFSNENLSIIPTKNINRINKFSSANVGKVKKADKAISYPPDIQEQLDVIIHFYEPYFTGKINDGKTYVELLSKNYLETNFDNISPDILPKVWSVEEGFIDFEYSLPYDASGGQFKIYVKEYWKNTPNRKVHYLIKENNRWVINSTSEEIIFTLI